MKSNSLLASCLMGALLTSEAAFAQQKGAAPAKGPGPKSQAEAQAGIQAAQNAMREHIGLVRNRLIHHLQEDRS